MKAILPHPVHESYLRHRKQFAWQIILPMVLTGILFIAMIVLVNIATFRDNGDVGRWAAISTIWIILPILVAGLVFFVVLAALIYLLARLLGITPTYTRQAQEFVYKISGYIKRGADAAVKPVIFLDSLGASIQAFLGRK